MQLLLCYAVFGNKIGLSNIQIGNNIIKIIINLRYRTAAKDKDVIIHAEVNK